MFNTNNESIEKRLKTLEKEVLKPIECVKEPKDALSSVYMPSFTVYEETLLEKFERLSKNFNELQDKYSLLTKHLKLEYYTKEVNDNGFKTRTKGYRDATCGMVSLSAIVNNGNTKVTLKKIKKRAKKRK